MFIYITLKAKKAYFNANQSQTFKDNIYICTFGGYIVQGVHHTK